MDKRIPFRVLMLLSLLLGSCVPAVVTTIDQQGHSRSVEPFNIKTNDILGIGLGATIADFTGADHSKENCSDDEGSQFCTIFPGDNLTVAGAKAGLIWVRYYGGHVIDINYSLRNYEWQSIVDALDTTFGKGI